MCEINFLAVGSFESSSFFRKQIDILLFFCFPTSFSFFFFFPFFCIYLFNFWGCIVSSSSFLNFSCFRSSNFSSFESRKHGRPLPQMWENIFFHSPTTIKRIAQYILEHHFAYVIWSFDAGLQKLVRMNIFYEHLIQTVSRDYHRLAE